MLSCVKDKAEGLCASKSFRHSNATVSGGLRPSVARYRAASFPAFSSFWDAYFRQRLVRWWEVSSSSWTFRNADLTSGFSAAREKASRRLRDAAYEQQEPLA